MGIYLEEYSRSKPKVLQQGFGIRRLVASESDWLKQDPDRKYTAKHYANLFNAIGSVARIASSEDLQAYIIRDRRHRVAIGLATVIFDQSVVHPEIGIVRGNNLDYWLRPSSDHGFHKEVAEELVLVSRKLTTEFISKYPYGHGYDIDTKNYPPLFVAVQNDSTIPPFGFTQPEELHVLHHLSLKPVGEPRELSVPEGQKDRYGIAAVGRVTQLYYRESETSSGLL